MGFLEQFLDVFSELKGSDFWVSGESVSQYSPCVHVPYLFRPFSMLASVSTFI